MACAAASTGTSARATGPGACGPSARATPRTLRRRLRRQSVQNREMRALLGEAASGPEEDLRLSALEAEGDRLRVALIARHVHAEESGDRALEKSILALLYRHAEARRLVIPIQPAV
jgi:hypothetical protein